MAMERMSSWLLSWGLIPQTKGGLVFGVTSVSVLNNERYSDSVRDSY